MTDERVPPGDAGNAGAPRLDREALEARREALRPKRRSVSFAEGDALSSSSDGTPSPVHALSTSSDGAPRPRRSLSFSSDGEPSAAHALLTAFNAAEDGERAPGSARTLSTAFDGFEALPHATGDVTYGPPTEIDGRAWSLYIYPGGIVESFKEYVSVHLALGDQAPNVKTDVTLRLINHAGRGHIVHTLKRGTIFGSNPCTNLSGWVVAPSNPSWGVVGFVRRADILDASQGWLNERGAIVIAADISVYCSEAPPPPSEPEPDPDVVWAMETLGVDAGVHLPPIGGARAVS